MITERNDCGLTSQLDQVLALIRGMPCRCMSVAQLGERDPGCDKCEATEKLEAIRAAVGGEAVAWQVPTPYGMGYNFASQAVMEDMADWLAPVPPATVDVGALSGLVEKWRGLQKGWGRNASTYNMAKSEAYGLAADELADLIGEKA